MTVTTATTYGLGIGRTGHVYGWARTEVADRDGTVVDVDYESHGTDVRLHPTDVALLATGQTAWPPRDDLALAIHHLVAEGFFPDTMVDDYRIAARLEPEDPDDLWVVAIRPGHPSDRAPRSWSVTLTKEEDR